MNYKIDIAGTSIALEIVDENNHLVPAGEPGEVVATTLGVEAMPLLRFRTGDIASMHTEQCACGRWSYRLSPLVGRKNNMIKLKGTTLYPPALNDVLDNTPYVQNYVDGKISREAFWALAKFKNPTHQMSFHTVRALGTLHFIQTEEVHYEK